MLAIGSPSPRRREKSKPVPPPNFWTNAVALAVDIIDSRVSSIGSTKQAASVPRPVPAFISVGEFGRKRSEDSASRKRCDQISRSSSVGSTAAIAEATRANSCSGVSTTAPESSRSR